jgi:hypothetical protein
MHSFNGFVQAVYSDRIFKPVPGWGKCIIMSRGYAEKQ